ncbi:MAG: PGPGW domain-containing protein [Gammaproteobacteria bacterium]
MTLAGYSFALPRSKLLRIALGMVLIIFGFLGFLPIVGFWMIPLGLMLLSYELSWIRRIRRRTAVWWFGRRRGKQNNGAQR